MKIHQTHVRNYREDKFFTLLICLEFNLYKLTRLVLFLLGLYWQFTWRFAAPILLAGILTASVVFELTSSPTYSVWNKDTVTVLLIKRASLLAVITYII